MFTIITENDESEWDDHTGVSYHFPKRYLKYLESNTRVIYYKGGMKNSQFRGQRLTTKPHYFGAATIGRVYADTKSTKGDYFAEILEFAGFKNAVPTKRPDGEYFESIPASQETNYWRNGVRPTSETLFKEILALADIEEQPGEQLTNDESQGLPDALSSAVEGYVSLRVVSDYERNPALRRAAVRIHGTTCKGCGFNFAEVYGEHGVGYIQVHHLRPLSEFQGEQNVNAENDLTVLCANCHVMVHRFRNKTLTLESLRALTVR